MKKLTSKIAAGCVALMLLAGFSLINSAFAQNHQERQQKAPNFSEILAKMDANKDGKLSKEEVEGPLKTDFSKIDTDEDGYITKEEFQNAPKPEKGTRPPRK
jgi:Ca2+-binding EF-hand superfamily protein